MEVPGCLAGSFYGGSRLPFDTLENSPNAPAISCISNWPNAPLQTFSSAQSSASEQPPAPACSLGGRQCSALLFFLFGLSLRVFLGNVPLFVVTWFARWHVMLDLNAAT